MEKELIIGIGSSGNRGGAVEVVVLEVKQWWRWRWWQHKDKNADHDDHEKYPILVFSDNAVYVLAFIIVTITLLAMFSISET